MSSWFRANASCITGRSGRVAIGSGVVRAIPLICIVRRDGSPSRPPPRRMPRAIAVHDRGVRSGMQRHRRWAVDVMRFPIPAAVAVPAGGVASPRQRRSALAGHRLWFLRREPASRHRVRAPRVGPDPGTSHGRHADDIPTRRVRGLGLRRLHHVPRVRQRLSCRSLPSCGCS